MFNSQKNLVNRLVSMNNHGGLNKRAVLLVLWVILFGGNSVFGFVHPGGLFKQSDLERMRYMVQAGVEPYLTSFNTLSADSRASYNYPVQGDPSWTEVNRGGIHGSEYESDVLAAYMNALMWAITEDSRHAEKCIEIFNTWKSLTDVEGGGTESLNAGLFVWKMVEAAEIIKSTYSGWSASDIQAFSDMLVYPGYSNTAVPGSVTDTNGSFYWRMYIGDPGRHGNQDMIAWRGMITMGVFLDNEIMYNRALNYFKGLPAGVDDIPYQSGPPNNSPSPITTTDYYDAYSLYSWGTSTSDYGYNGVLGNYFWENGQCQESSRDQAHTFFGLSIAAGIAEVAWNQGDGVYNSLDNRLLKGFEYTAKYNTSYLQSYSDQPTPWEPTAASGEFIQRFDRTGRWYSKKINPYSEGNFTSLTRGDFPGKRPCFEQGVAHFQVRMGEDVTWTERARDYAIAESGYETTGWNQDHPGWGALCFRRPTWCAGDPVSGFSNDTPVFQIPVVPAVIEAENYDDFPVDGQTRTYVDTTSGNSGAQYRTDQSVDIEVCSKGGYNLTDMVDGEWLSYTLHVPATDTYTIGVRYAANGSGGRIKFAFDGNDVTNEVTLPDTGGFSNWATRVVSSSSALTKGVQTMRVYVFGTSNSYKLDRIVINDGPLCDEFLLSDLNQDCYVNLKDFAILASEWLLNNSQ